MDPNAFDRFINSAGLQLLPWQRDLALQLLTDPRPHRIIAGQRGKGVKIALTCGNGPEPTVSSPLPPTAKVRIRR